MRRLCSSSRIKRVLSRCLLLSVSLLFYLSFGLKNFAVLFVQSVLGYILYRLILYAGAGPAKRAVFAVSEAAAVASLAFFKYASPFFPVALSFTTFSLISFLADAYRSDPGDAAQRVPFYEYLLYFFFFPKLLHGPIMRFEDFKSEETRADSFEPDMNSFAGAVFYFVLGLSKKVLLADALSRVVDFAYAAPESLLWFEAVIAVIAYAFQIYFDFSGYCDMGRAAARMLGFDLPRNFDRPYLAQNVAEFWRRWHMTLSSFFTRYVYIPLGGSRRGVMRRLVNTMAVFLLSGIWHGQGVSFILWGALHGIGVCAAACLKKPLRLPAFVKRAMTCVYTFLALVLFRAQSMGDALAMYLKIFDKPWFKLHDRFVDTFRDDLFWYPLKVLGVSEVRTGGLVCMWLLLGLSALFVFVTPDAERISEKFSSGLKGGHCRPGLAALFTGALFIWCVLSLGEVSSFVYFRF